MKKEICVSIDMIMSGALIKNKIIQKGYSIKEIQKRLKLSCPQPIYRWMRGQTMPSIDNLYTLSSILGLHMEELLIPRDDALWIMHDMENNERRIRLKKYYYYRVVGANG